MDKQVEFLVKLRDAGLMIADAANEYLETMAPPQAKTKETQQPAAAVQELTFKTLKFGAQRGARLGEYEIAHKASNLPDKWSSAYNILRSSNATIRERYQGVDYEYSYWLYGEDKIYRQKLKPKTQS
jgi:hypothetical protein